MLALAPSARRSTTRMRWAAVWNEWRSRTTADRLRGRRGTAQAELRTPGRAARKAPGGTGFVLLDGSLRVQDGSMTSRREYCPIACGVDVLGDRWTPLIIRELMVGAHGFNEIHRGIPRVSRNLLASRLRELERRGLVTHGVGDPGRSGTYELTEAGHALTP